MEFRRTAHRKNRLSRDIFRPFLPFRLQADCCHHRFVAYDAATAKVVLFSGSGPLNDTWLYDGTNWSQASTESRPLARYGAAVTYDSMSGKIVLVGGAGAFDDGGAEPNYFFCKILASKTAKSLHPFINEPSG